MTNWLEPCRAAVADVRGVLAELPTRAEREPVVGQGLGGDETTAVDRAAEDAFALGARRHRGEHRLDVGHRSAAQLQPISHSVTGSMSSPDVSFG